MALRVVTVQSAGGDYSSLNAAFIGEVGDLVSLNRQLEIDCYNFDDSTAAASGAGWTTDATHTVLIPAVDSHNGVYGGIGGASSYRCSGGVQSQIAYATFRNLSLGSISKPAGSALQVFGQPGVIVDRCIGAIGGGASGYACFELQNGAIGVDCIAIGGGFSGAATSCVLYNCLAIAFPLNGFGGTGWTDTITAKNCVAVPSSGGTGFSNTATWTGSSNCASTDATSPNVGAGHRINQTIALVNPNGGDYRLLSTDTGAKGFGTDLSADATYPFAIDIAGVARTVPWDIGAFVPVNIPHIGLFPRRAAFGLVGMM